jgi:hypothetical protein
MKRGVWIAVIDGVTTHNEQTSTFRARQDLCLDGGKSHVHDTVAVRNAGGQGMDAGCSLEVGIEQGQRRQRAAGSDR